jgi:bacterial/archaeal transporter family-2 protein
MQSSTAPQRNHKRIGLAAAVLGGLGVAVQSKINGALGAKLSDGIAAALISFGSGLILVAIIVGLQPAARHGLTRVRSAIRRGDLRFYQCLGGTCGALLVASQGLTVSILGVAIFTVALVGGQAMASLLVDRLGVGPAGPQPLTWPRVAGAVLAIIAVLIAVGDRIATPSAAAAAILPAIAGAGSAWQQAVNGRVRAASDSVMSATLINFIMGTGALLVAFAIDLLVRGWPSGHLPSNPIYYIGGSLGVVFIAIAAAVVRHTGVLLLGLSMVAGQLIGALLIDLVVPGPEGRPGVNTLIGVALTLVAVLIASVRVRVRTPESASV